MNDPTPKKIKTNTKVLNAIILNNVDLSFFNRGLPTINIGVKIKKRSNDLNIGSGDANIIVNGIYVKKNKLKISMLGFADIKYITDIMPIPKIICDGIDGMNPIICVQINNVIHIGNMYCILNLFVIDI